MKKLAVSFILGLVVGLLIGHIVAEKRLFMQEVYYVNQLHSVTCELSGVCD